MVHQPIDASQSERRLDDVILAVFESRDPALFYFPLTSQRAAREFVCELERRCARCEALMCVAVGEHRANFTAWRTGANWPGVGNRVVERINRPLQQLLMQVAFLAMLLFVFCSLRR